MDSSAAADDGEKNSSSSVEQTTSSRLPEDYLNLWILFKAAFIYKAMNGLGVLASIWATVVLLGGFSTLVKQVDFWYVTAIAFVQFMGILGGYEDPAHQIFMRAPDALRKESKTPIVREPGSWWRRRHPRLEQQSGSGGGTTTAASSSRRRRRSRQELLKKRQAGVTKWQEYLLWNGLGDAIVSALSLLQVAAVAACMYLSWKRLKKHDYVDLKYLDKDDHQNIGSSLSIFYKLVLAQGFIFILLQLEPLTPHLRLLAQRKYNLFWHSSEIIFRYKNEHYLDFIAGNVRATLDTDLITYAKNMAVSGSLDDQLLGVRAMDYILRPVECRSLVLRRLRASLDDDALGKLVSMLGFFRTTEDQDMRGHAARVVLKLAPDLLLQTCPTKDRILYLTSYSLLPNASSSSSSNKAVAAKTEDADLVWLGLRILDKLTDKPENCKEANNDADHDLLPKIMDLLTNLCGGGTHGGSTKSSNTLSDSWVQQEIIPLLQGDGDIPLNVKQKIDQEIIVGMSLNILSKLLAAPGAAGVLERHSSKDFRFLTNTGVVSKHVGAKRAISCLAMDAKGRKEIGMLPAVIRNLKCSLLSEVPYLNITKVAAKLLLLEYATDDHLINQIQMFIEENRILEDQLPVSAFIQELDLDHQLSMPLMRREVQRLDLEDLLSAPRPNHSGEAAKALYLLTTECEDNVVAFLQEISPIEMEKIVNALSSEEGEKQRRRMLAHFEGRHLKPEMLRVIKKILSAEGDGLKRSMHAKLLQNLRAYSKPEKFRQHMRVIDNAMPTVIKAILDEVAILEDPSSTDENLAHVKDDLWIEGGKVLENFIGLAAQICSSLDTSSFVEKLRGAGLTVETWVKKLKTILELYNSPTTDFPYIRRSTLELLIWMVERDSSNIEILLQCGVYEQLQEVKKTARKLESFKLFHCGDGVAVEPGIPCISSLATELQQKLQRSPNFKERDPSTISVLID